MLLCFLLLSNVYLPCFRTVDFRATFEELSVRGNFALNQEKVLDDYFVSTGEADEEEMEEEYNRRCNKVVSLVLITLF